MTTHQVLGNPSPRVDGYAKVTGKAGYTTDKSLPGMLWSKCLRSPYPHARIISIDVSKAIALPGVHAVLTGEDVKGVLYGRRMRDVPVLAYEKVRFVGERVAAVAAMDPEIAQRAVDLIDVEYEVLPAVFEPIEALQPEAPIIHENIQQYAGLPKPLDRPTNGFVKDVWGRGSIEIGFQESEVIIEGTYSTQRTHQAYLEPHAGIVWIDEEGRVQVWAPNKAPHRLKLNLADAIGLELEKIVVHHSTIGADFGGKGSPMDIPVAYFLAKKTGRPVKTVLTYAEEFSAANPRHPSIIWMRTGMKKDGTFLAHEAKILFNSGAYGGYKPVPGVNLPGAAHAAGMYRFPHSRIEATIVYTNSIPGGFFRGPGAVQATFAMESHMDVIASKLGIEPLELRRKNLVEKLEDLPNGFPGISMEPEQTLDAAINASGYLNPKPNGIGRGIAVCFKDQGEGVSSSAVTFNADGSIILNTSVFEQGTGTYTALSQIVAEALGIDAKLITVIPWDTDDGPFDSGVGASRVTRVSGPSAYEAAKLALSELLNRAAVEMECKFEELQLDGTFISRIGHSDQIAWAKLVDSSPAVGRFTNEEHERSPIGSAMVQIAEVAIDKETGRITLLKLTSAHDVGVVINPTGHQGQINGGVAQGLGQAMMEELIVDQGYVQTLSFADYKLPAITDMPQLVTALVTTDEGSGPYKTKGIGEYSIEGIAAAVANAVQDACGVRISDAPVTAEKIYQKLSH
tara:strand:+ start:873 stop:3089 length:2217 start_codon:yes stop_codon:yes gene_type:complete